MAESTELIHNKGDDLILLSASSASASKILEIHCLLYWAATNHVLARMCQMNRVRIEHVRIKHLDVTEVQNLIDNMEHLGHAIQAETSTIYSVIVVARRSALALLLKHEL